MKKSKKSILNMVFGIGNQLIVLIFGLVVPKIFITTFGSEVNGLQSSIGYLYTYIALLESGIGTATIQALFKTIGHGDKDETNAVLAATNLQYKRVAVIYACVVSATAFVFPLTIHTEVPCITVVGMFLLSGVGSFVSFISYGKFVLLLQADGRSYIVSTVSLIDYILKNVIKIVLILMGYSFFVVYLGSAMVAFLNLLIYSIYKRKHYIWVNYYVEPQMLAIKQSKNVLVHQISNILCNSTDVLVLTYIVGNLALVSVYNLYAMIFDAIKSLIQNMLSSVNFIMGQTYHSDIEKYREYHHIYEVIDMFVSFTLYSTAYVMMTPFLRVYTAGFHDIEYIDRYLPLLFVSIKLMLSCREPASLLINYAGHFKQTQTRSIIETTINVVVSIVSSYFLGIYGVLLGTVVALAYRTIDMYFYTSGRFLNRSVWESAKQWLIYMSAFFGIIIASERVEIVVNGYFQFFATAAIVGTILLVYYLVFTCIFNFDVVRLIQVAVYSKIGKKGN